MRKLKVIVMLFIATSILVSCFEDNDDNAVSTTSINDFVWKGLNLWYFWQESVPDLADDRFATDTDFTNYLNDFATPDLIFNNLLFSEDRFSWIVSDFNELTSNLNGIFKTNGVEFGLARISGGSDLVGYVQYILPNTDASTMPIARGDFFLTVNGTQLTDTNFTDLLFNDALDSYTLGMADSALVLNGTEISLTKQEYTENPIFIANTFDVGTTKVGYLMYNRFTSSFDDALNNVFGNFISEGVTQLVLDLRYNSGGSVNSAVNLGSMIAGEPATSLFLKQRWNSKIQDALSDEQLNTFFATNVNGNSLNALNLDTVYILTESGSASASELVINSLNPYVTVIQIGDTTTGKNEFSITLFDIPSCSYVNGSNCDASPNPLHTWAMQPLVGRNENAVGFLDFTNGFTPEPTFLLSEDITNLGILGDENEPLLARAIQHISGGGRLAPIDNTNALRYPKVANSSYFTLLKDNMYLDMESPF